MEVAGDKLVAVFEDIPDIVMQAFQKRLYRNVSVEMSFDVQHKGTLYDFVITAVALLGADIPAVNVLNDLGALMSRNSNLARGEFLAGSHASFNAVFGTIQEKSTMTPEEEAQLRLDLATAQANAITAKATFAALEASAAAEKKAADERFAAIEASQKKTSVDAKRASFTAILEDAVKAKTITPVQRETYAKVLRLDNDDHILTLDESDVKALFAASGKPTDKDTGRTNEDEDEGDSPGTSLVGKAHEYMAKSGEKDFSRAVNIVMAGNPDLARDYLDSNGEVRQ